MSKIQQTLNTARPTSWKDTLIRAAKTGIATLITTIPLNTFASLDLDAIKVAAIAAASAAGSVLINAILTWTQSPE